MVYLTEFLYISECIKLILDKNKDLIKVQDNYGWTVFHYVTYNDLYTTIEVLAGAGKSVASSQITAITEQLFMLQHTKEIFV